MSRSLAVHADNMRAHIFAYV